MGKLECTKKACDITTEIFELILKNFDFKTELDIKRFIAAEAKKRKVKLAFPPVVATGKNAAEPHHRACKDKIKKGFLVMDLGVKYRGYCADLSRTVFVGRPSKKDRYYYELVRMVQKMCVNKLRKGVRYSGLDAYARESFGDEAKYFIHALGHGVGSQIHQFPTIISDHGIDRKKLKKKSLKKIDRMKNVVAKEGDFVTIEPGVYLKNKFGIRIEDLIVVGKRKSEILTKTSKKLYILKSP